MEACTTLAGIGSTGIPIRTVNGSVNAIPSHALVSGAGIIVVTRIQNVRATAILTEVVRARIEIVTIDLRMQTDTIHATIGRT